MADLKISQLPSVAEQDIAGVDEIPLNDVSASQTSKVAVKDLIERGFALADAGSIPATLLAALPTSSVTAASIDGKAITRNQIADNTIQAGQIDSNTITSNEIVSNSLTNVLAPGSISSTELDALSVGTTELQLLAVGNDQVANTSLTYAKLNLSDGDIPGSKINTLDGSKIIGASIGNAKISDVDGSKIVDGSISYAKLDSNDIARGLSIDSTAGTLGIANNISSGSGTFAGISYSAQGLITSVGTTIPATDLPIADANNLGAVKIGTGIAIANGVISIDASTIEAGNLAANAVETNNILDLNVTDGKIAGVSGSKISAGTVTYDKLDSADVGRGLSIDNTAGNIGIANSITAGQKGAFTYNSQGLITGTRTIPGSDIEPATTSATGVVKIGSGLSVDSSGEASVSGVTAAMVDTNAVGRGLDISGGTIGIATSLSGSGSFAGVNFNSSGIITSVDSVIPSSDLPKAGTTSSGLGCVYVPSGSGLALNTSTGELSVDASGLPEASIGDLAVSTGKLADGAVTDLKVTAVSGSKLTAGSVTYDKLDANDIARGLSIDSTAGTLGIANSISSGSFAGISYDTTGLITSVAALIPATDLPIATTTTVGAVSISDGLSITTAGALSVSGITNAMLGTDSVRTLQVEDLAITDAKITGVSGAKITAGTLSPNALSSANVTNGLTVSGGNLQIDNSVSGGASSFAGLSYNAQGLITNVSALIPATDLPISSSTALGAVKVGPDFSIDSSTGVLSVAVDGIENVNLSDDCVGTNELAPGAVDNAALGSGLSGAKISTNSLPADAIVTTDLDRSINLSNGKIGINNAQTPATVSGLQFNSEGLIVGTSSILASELPISTALNVGAVSIGSNSGLSVSNAGALTLSNSYSGNSSINGLVINSFGQITSTSQITGSDINVASTSSLGVIKVASGGPFSIDVAGELSLANSGVGAGTYTSVTVDTLGRVTAASQITEAQLPNHSAAKITSGTLDISRIANNAIGGALLSDASTTLFGGPGSTSNIVTFPSASFKGQRFWDEYHGDEYIWTGSSWQAVTITGGELIYGGTYNAASGQNVVASVTTAGAAAGLQTGTGLPTPSATNIRVYVVVSDSGTGTGNAPNVALAPPDMLVSNGTNSWDLVDVSNAIAGQTASNIAFTPYQNLASTNAQAVIQELDDIKVGKAGVNIISGTLEIGTTGVLKFEGSTPNDYETTLQIIDPLTADRVLSLPDNTGTLVSTGSSGVVTSSMLSNDIANSNIASNCALSFTKLEALNSGNILVGNASNDAASVPMTGDVGIDNAGLTTIQPSSIVDSMIDSTTTISALKIQGGSTSNAGVLQLVDSTSSVSTTLAATANSVKTAYDLADTANTTASAAAAKSGDTFTGNLIIDNAKEIRFTELSPGSNYISFKAPDAITSDISLVWPDTSPSPGQILKANASNANQLEWSSDAIDVAAANLTGTTLASNVTASSLTSVGTLGSLTVSGGISADVTGALTGNADTATKLVNARSINSVAFDGTQDILITADASTLSGTSLNSSITSSSLTAVGTLANLSVTNTISGSIDGNSSTSTKFASSVNIGGVAFDGSTDISLPGVNSAGNQNTSGNAASATQFTVTANNADETVYPVFVDGSSSYQDGEVDTGLTYNPSSGKLTASKFEGDGSLLTGVSTTPAGSNREIQFNNNGAFGSNSQVFYSTGSVLTAPYFAGGGYSLTGLNAANLGYGIIPDARFPSTLPAASGTNLTDLPAANITGTLPAISGANLTYLDLGDATNTGQIPVARLGSSGSASSSTFLRGDNSWATVSGTTINNNANNRLITGSGTANTLEAESGLTWDGTNLDMGDGKAIRFGSASGGDLRIFHSSGLDYIESASGNGLYITDGGSNNFLIASPTQCSLYASGSVRLLANSSGVAITGTCTATSGFSGSGANLTNLPAGQLTGTLPALNGSNLTNISASDSTKLPLNGGTLTGDLTIDNSGSSKIKIKGHDSPVVLDVYNASGSQIYYQHYYNSQMWFWQTNNRGLRLPAGSSDDYEVYTSSNNWATLLTELNVGSGGKLSSKNVYVNEIHAASVASSANGMRRITTATTAPSSTSGFADGDLYIVYTP